jgi:hypothetical protein
VEIVIGSLLVAGATLLILYLTLWSRGKINRLAELGFPTARDAHLEMSDD